MSASAEVEAAVRARAYHLWEADGRPDGRAEHYWHIAEAELARPKRKPAARAAGKKPKKAKD